MKLRPMTVLHLKRMWDRVEIKIALCVILVLIALSFVELCLHFYGFERDALPSAAYGWIGNMDVMQIVAIHIWFYLLFFILSASVYADSIEADRKRQTAILLATRTSMADYVRSSACVTFIGGFAVVFVPLLLSQLLSLLIFPLNSPEFGFQALMNEGAHLDNIRVNIISRNVLFPNLYFNHPYVLNLMYMLYASLIGGLVSVITLGISLFRSFRRPILIGLPMAIVFIVSFILPRSLQMQFYFFPEATLEGLSYGYFFGLPVVLALMAAFLLWYPIRAQRDILL